MSAQHRTSEQDSDPHDVVGSADDAAETGGPVASDQPAGAAAAPGRRNTGIVVAGHVTRRARELDITNHALLLASLGLTVLIPGLITIGAFLPLGGSNGLAAGVGHRFGLPADAANDLRRIFPTHKQAAGATTVAGTVATMFWAVGWPTELARGYQAIWNLPGRGIRDLWRAVPWLLSFFGAVAYIVWLTTITSGGSALLLRAVMGVPLVLAWTWWSQHLLLGGRVGWRDLVPGAVVTSAALFGFSLTMKFYLPRAIVSNFNHYGPIGVVFVLLTWLSGFALAMLGGALVGHIVWARRHRDTRTPDRTE